MDQDIFGLGNSLKIKFDDNPKIEGLNVFRKCLEKHFFSDVSVRNCSSDKNFVNLVVEMNTNFNLNEALYFLKNKIMRDTAGKNTNKIAMTFSKAFSKLQESNGLPIDIEEFSFFLNNVSIIVKRVYQNSIPNQLKNILNAIGNNYEYYTKQFQEVPFEIYIPVFEDDSPENSIKILDIMSLGNTESDYFKYWGLYFDFNDDAVVYDLKKSSTIYTDVNMLNY
jgi:hypothetical protein